MKTLKPIITVFLFGLIFLILTYAIQDNGQNPERIVKGIDAKKALTIANEWKWTQKEIISYVNTREVVF